MRGLCLAAVLLTACEARVGSPETPPDGSSTDAPVIDPDTQPVCQKRQLYLSFEGETLTDGATSDAKTNVASWMTNGITSATAPPYHAAQADRSTDIQIIVDEVTSRLAPFAIAVTTIRPPTGDYMMIVFGGAAATMGSDFGFVQELDCGDQVRNDVAWVDDGFPDALVPNAVVGSIGFAIGLTATTDPTDCMCSWDNDCRHNTMSCVLHNGIARDPNANQRCDAAPAVQDEIIEFNLAFCN